MEPLTTGAQIEQYKEWIDAYRDTTGESLAFLQTDLWYTLPRWPQLVRELEVFARSRGVAFGVIYNGDGQDVSDKDWLGRAQRRFELHETEGGRPEHAVLQSWTDKPDRVLPETRGTFTNLILRYKRPRTRLQVAASAGKVAGRLVAAAGCGSTDPLCRAHVSGKCVPLERLPWRHAQQQPTRTAGLPPP